VPALVCKPEALRNGAPFKGWVMPFGLENICRKLRRRSDGDRQMVDIPCAVLTDGLPAVEVTRNETLEQDVRSADVILNVLLLP
jgi:hypothetical protein